MSKDAVTQLLDDIVLLKARIKEAEDTINWLKDDRDQILEEQQRSVEVRAAMSRQMTKLFDGQTKLLLEATAQKKITAAVQQTIDKFDETLDVYGQMIHIIESRTPAA